MKIETKFDIGDKFTVNPNANVVDAVKKQIFTVQEIFIEPDLTIKYIGTCEELDEIFHEEEMCLYDTKDKQIEDRLSIFAV